MSDLVQALRLAGSASAWKQPCRVVAVANVAVTGLQTIDGVALAQGDRVLLTAQTDATENGPWVASSGRWWRAEDWGTDVFAVLGTTITVLAGTTYALSQWSLSSPTTGSIVIGETELTFTRSDVAHGDLAGGALHALASSLAAGFMSQAHFDMLVAATADLVLGTLIRRPAAENLPVRIQDIESSRVHGPDADTLPIAMYFRGGRPSIANLGKEPYANAVFEAGISAQSTLGETSQINFMYGDERDTELGPKYIAAEIGFIGSYGYDPATTESDGASPPGTRTWREKTPYYWRLHATQNTNNGKLIGIMINAGRDLSLIAGTRHQQSLTARGGDFLRSWPNFLPTTPTAGDGCGGSEVVINRYCTTTGAETKNLYIGSDGPNGKLSYWECKLIAHQAGGSREVFKFKFSWLGAASNQEPYIHDIGDFGVATGTGYASRSGRVVVDHNGSTGQAKIAVTGLPGITIGWTLRMEGLIPPIGI